MSITTPSPDLITAADDAAAAPKHWTGAEGRSPWLAVAGALVAPLAERAADHDRTGSFVHEGVTLVREHGLLSMLVPADRGGGGATYAETCAVLSGLAHGCPATSLTLSMHTHLVAAQVWRHRRGLPAPALDAVAGRQAVLVSTGASDWIDSSGTARKVDGGFHVSGRKAPASGSPAGDIVVTSIRWDDAPDGPQVLHLSVPFTADGVRIDETWDTMGMRGTGSHTVVLDDVFVADAAIALARPAGRWHPVWNTVMGVAMPVIMSSYVGVAEAIAERALAVAAQRRSRADVPALFGRMQNQLTAARDAVRAMIDMADGLDFDNTTEHAALVLARKTNATDAVLAVGRLALEVGGGSAFAVAGGIERLYRDLHGARYHPLPAAQQERFSGRVALGLDPVGD